MAKTNKENIEENQTNVVNLNEFLKPLNSDESIKDVEISDRFPAPFQIKKMTGKDQFAFARKIENNRTQAQKLEAGLELVVECCVNPNFKSAEVFQQSTTKKPTDAVLELLWTDELNKLINAINIHNGFVDDPAKLQDEAKK